jgi:hypothetical protein
MASDYFHQKAAYNHKKDDNIAVSKGFQDFIDTLPKTYEPKDIRIGSKLVMTYEEDCEFIKEDENGEIVEDGSIQSSD